MGFGTWGLGFEVWGLGFGVWGLGCGVWGLGFGVATNARSVFEVRRVWGLGCRMQGCEGSKKLGGMSEGSGVRS